MAHLLLHPQATPSGQLCHRQSSSIQQGNGQSARATGGSDEIEVEVNDAPGDLSALPPTDPPAVNAHIAFAEILAEVNPDSPLVASILDDHAPKDTVTVSILPKAAPKLSDVSLVSKDDVYPELS